MPTKIEADWIDEATSLRCLIVLHDKPPVRYRCGYVELPGGAANDVDEYEHLDVHGGVTFTGINPGNLNDSVLIGFDCAHAGDFDSSPYTVSNKSFDFVKGECVKLARQVREMGT